MEGISIRVPATSANLGPGFDCLGLALNLYARFDFEPAESGLVISGCRADDANENNLVWRAYARALQYAGKAPGGLRLRISSDIPVSRGLGSSAACAVGGILGADRLHRLRLTEEEMLNLAAELEGHPDNAAPALFGGLRVSLTEQGRALSLPAPVHPSLRFLSLVPDFELLTSAARTVLPVSVPLRDAVFNLSRAAFLLKAMEEGDIALIRLAMQDRLHQDARFALIPGAAKLKQRMEGLGAACCLSGAGPSLLCLYTEDDFPARARGALEESPISFTALPLALCREGAEASPRP